MIDRLLATPTTTALLRFDHVEIGRLAQRLLWRRAALAEGPPGRDGATQRAR